MGRIIDLRRPDKVTASIDPSGLATEAKQDTIIGHVSRGANASVTSIAQSASSALLIASAATRKEVIIMNTASKNLWISYTTPAVVGKGIKLAKDEFLIEDQYTGAIYGIWDAAGADNAQVTQVTQ